MQSSLLATVKQVSCLETYSAKIRIKIKIMYSSLVNIAFSCIIETVLKIRNVILFTKIEYESSCIRYTDTERKTT